MKPQIFFLLLSVSWALSPCSKGCLICNSSKCLLCNANSKFFPSPTGECKPAHIPNCAFEAQNYCLKCNRGYFQSRPYKIVLRGGWFTKQKLVEEAADECQKLSHPVPNCRTHAADRECKLCEPGFFLTPEKKCLAFPQNIENCEQTYLDSARLVRCKLCKFGYMLTADHSQCRAFESDPHCLVSSNFVCNRCKPGFYIDYDPNTSSKQEISHWASSLTSLKREPFKTNLLFQCKTKVPFCSDFAVENGKCVRCTSGHYLTTEGSCTPGKIENCKLYANGENCLECYSGFYSIGPKCEKVNEPIKFCKLYKDANSCKVCEDPYFLFDSNDIKQEKREEELILITNTLHTLVAQLKNYQGKTEKQLNEFLTNLGKDPTLQTVLHLVNIEKLLEKKPTSVASLGLQCVGLHVENCSVYSKGVCVKCESTHYLQKKTCVEIPPEKLVPDCSAYTEKGACAECRQGFLLFGGECMMGSHFSNCAEEAFIESGVCLMCRHNYFFDVKQRKCVERVEEKEKNCLVMSSVHKRCLLCAEECFMNENELCECPLGMDSSSEVKKQQFLM